MSNFNFYLLPAQLWTTMQSSGNKFLLLECQPYGVDRYYRIATIEPVEALSDFACKDKGRTKGWFQCYLGKGIYRAGRGKIKLPKDVLVIIDALEDGEISFAADTWTDIINGWVQKMNLVTQTKNNNIEGDK